MGARIASYELAFRMQTAVPEVMRLADEDAFDAAQNAIGGGGTVWDSIVYDPQTNLVLFGTGNAEPWNPNAVDRGTGDALYTASIVAVDADTGQYRWHFQETPEDRWDFDSDAQIMIADLEIGGPGFCFPVLRWTGKTFAVHRQHYEGKPCRR